MGRFARYFGLRTRVLDDFTHRHGRGPLPEENDALAGNRWVFADKPRSAR